MKDVELALELLITLEKRESLNKKTAINTALEKKDRAKKEIAKLSSKFKAIIRLLRQLHLGRNTRFARKTSDFYSLFKSFMDLHNGKIIFNSRQSFAEASKELTTFSASVVGIAEAFTNKRFGYIKKNSNTPFYKYWLTTQSGTDSKEHRDTRTEIFKGIIGRSFNSGKDKKRFFTVNQKEQVWDASKDKNCSFPNCDRTLSWETATVDHTVPWSQGGMTEVSNAQLMCKMHNSMKKDKEFSRFFVSLKKPRN